MWLCIILLLFVALKKLQYRFRYNCGSSPAITSTDETSLHQSTLVSRPRERRQLSPNQKPCVLPPYPDHGSYTMSNITDAIPGESFESFELRVSCRRGYGFVESDSKDGTGPLRVFCLSGTWSQSMPECVRFCKLDPDPSVRYSCHVPGAGFKTCGTYVPPDTIVNPVCNSPIYYSTESLRYMKCISGFWDYVAKCKAECGRVTPEGEQLLIGGTRAQRGELPWHAGIYTKNAVPYMQICGGSLVSNNVVISAAHCFWNDVRMQLPASEFAIAVGKLHRPWNNDKDQDAQKSDVKEIHLPPLFYGSSSNFQEDVAVVVVVTPFVYKTYVRPVCINFDANFERRQLEHGKLGKVAGWGLLGANGKASPVLQVVEMPYITLRTCIETVPPSFREYITGDKFCAGYTNGTALCKGDSGGGLAFSALELDVDRYYLRGVVSAAPSSEDLCNAYTYTAFTRITKHEDFIKRSIADADKTCPPYLFQCNDGACVGQGADCNGKQDCADGSDESYELCNIGIVEKNLLPKAACVIPPLIDNGRYGVIPYPNASPGQTVNALLVQVSCEDGYDIVNTNGRFVKLNVILMSCIDGKWEDAVPKCRRRPECGESPNSSLLEHGDRVSKKGELPWHVAIYTKMQTPYQHICGGNIISKTAVLTAAHCFLKGNDPSHYAVASGKHNSAWDHEDDVDAQKSDVIEIWLSNLYKANEKNNYKGDIAVMLLETPITFTSTIRPVCLNLNNNFNNEELIPGELVRVAAWDFSNSSRLQKLTTVDMTFLDLTTCHNTIHAKLQIYNTADKVCAGYRKDRNLFKTLAGSGVVYPQREDVERFYLIGVTSYVAPCSDCVGSNGAYYLFTSIYDNRDFIKQYI